MYQNKLGSNILNFRAKNDDLVFYYSSKTNFDPCHNALLAYSLPNTVNIRELILAESYCFFRCFWRYLTAFEL